MMQSDQPLVLDMIDTTLLLLECITVVLYIRVNSVSVHVFRDERSMFSSLEFRSPGSTQCSPHDPREASDLSLLASNALQSSPV